MSHFLQRLKKNSQDVWPGIKIYLHKIGANLSHQGLCWRLSGVRHGTGRRQPATTEPKLHQEGHQNPRYQPETTFCCFPCFSLMTIAAVLFASVALVS